MQSDPHHFQPISCQYDVVENPHPFTPHTSCICQLLAVTNGTNGSKCHNWGFPVRPPGFCRNVHRLCPMIMQCDPHHFQPISCQYDVVENPHPFTPRTSCICQLLAVTNGTNGSKCHNWGFPVRPPGFCRNVHRLFPMIMQCDPHHFQPISCQYDVVENPHPFTPHISCLCQLLAVTNGTNGAKMP